MKVLLAGATGAIGRPLVSQLLQAGHEVIGMTRSEQRARLLSSAGAATVISDVLDAGSLRRIVEEAAPDVVVDQTTDLPQRAGFTRAGIRRFYRGQLRLEQHGKPALLQAAIAAGVSRYVMQSIAFIYAPGAPAARTEDDPIFDSAPAPWSKVLPPLLALEDQVTNSTVIAGVVLRYGYFYGPGTHFAPGGQFYEQTKRRRFPLVGDGAGVWSFVHVDDAAAAAVAAIDHGQPGIYNVVDDDPAPLKVWLPIYASLLALNRPCVCRPCLRGRFQDLCPYIGLQVNLLFLTPRRPVCSGGVHAIPAGGRAWLSWSRRCVSRPGSCRGQHQRGCSGRSTTALRVRGRAQPGRKQGQRALAEIEARPFPCCLRLSFQRSDQIGAPEERNSQVTEAIQPSVGGS